MMPGQVWRKKLTLMSKVVICFDQVKIVNFTALLNNKHGEQRKSAKYYGIKL